MANSCVGSSRAFSKWISLKLLGNHREDLLIYELQTTRLLAGNYSPSRTLLDSDQLPCLNKQTDRVSEVADAGSQVLLLIPSLHVARIGFSFAQAFIQARGQGASSTREARSSPTRTEAPTSHQLHQHHKHLSFLHVLSLAGKLLYTYSNHTAP